MLRIDGYSISGEGKDIPTLIKVRWWSFTFDLHGVPFEMAYDPLGADYFLAKEFRLSPRDRRLWRVIGWQDFGLRLCDEFGRCRPGPLRRMPRLELPADTIIAQAVFYQSSQFDYTRMQIVLADNSEIDCYSPLPSRR